MTVTVSNVAADTVAPTVAVTAPTNGATVSGTINATANATDAVGVTRVEFLRDGTVLGQDTTSPYSMSFNTTTVTNGSHTFGARAYDAAGNTGTATNVTATVSNVAPTTGCAVSTANAPDGTDGSGGCWPGPASTGVPAGTTLTTYTGSCALSSGTYDAKVFNCDPTINGTVTITRSRVNGSIQVASTGNLTISDSYVDASPTGRGKHAQSGRMREAPPSPAPSLSAATEPSGVRLARSGTATCTGRRSRIHGTHRPFVLTRTPR